MNRKTFVKLASAISTTPLLSFLPDLSRQKKLENWAGNLTYSTNNVFYPKSVSEVQSLVKKCDHLRGLGTRHCFNTIADSKYNLISSNSMNKILSLDTVNKTVTVEGGIKYGELAPFLDKKGFALHNLASLPHISVAGSISTATHGSGVKNGNLSTQVRGMEIVIADGSIVKLSKEKDGENFNAAVVGLGAFGIITKVTLDLRPAYQVSQRVFVKMPLSSMKDHFEEIVSAGYSVSLFTDWQSESINEVWIKEIAESHMQNHDADEFYGARAATKNLHPIIELSAENCTPQMGVAGPWYERLPHFKMGFTPSSGKELQSEYFIPKQHAVEAISAIQKMGKQIGPHLFITEIRTIAADQLWLSPCRNQDSVTIHFTWKQEWDEVKKLLPLIENELATFNPRPHWGKLFTMPGSVLESRYEKLTEFKKMVVSYDPKGKFRNDFLERTIY
ncbi:MAG: FAD-binding protein [Bacteroidota bacterium]|nr:FAD-binding protein [Bacteroidota bacterium]